MLKNENLTNRKIFIVRHGQTDYNLRNVVQGSGIDADLNLTGEKQAEAFFEANKHITFDRVFYSGLKRTKQTVSRFLDLGLPSEGLPDLNEVSWGKYEGVPMDHQENEYYLNMIRLWREGDLDHAIDGGESPNMAGARLRKGIERVLAQEGETILVCMHGRAIRILLCILLNYDLRYMDLFQHQNLCSYRLTQLGNWNFRLDGYSPCPLPIA